MLIRTVRKPGEAGTQQLVQKYGDRLVCVRYRYDPQKRRRYKTVELIIAEEDWQSEAEKPDAPPAAEPPREYTPRVPVRINCLERDLQRQLKAIGGTWNAEKKL